MKVLAGIDGTERGDHAIECLDGLRDVFVVNRNCKPGAEIPQFFVGQLFLDLLLLFLEFFQQFTNFLATVILAFEVVA